MHKTKHTIPLLILFSFTLFSCSQAAEDPKALADHYWQHMQNGNTVEAEKLVSLNSRYTFSDTKDRVKHIAQLTNSDAITIVKTTITTINPETNHSHTQTFDTVLVLQQGQWKIDANRSQIPPTSAEKEEQLKQLAEDLSDSMQENIESIDETMTQGMQMLNEALHEGSKEMGDSLLHLMNKLNSSMQESIDNMKQRRQQQQDNQADDGVI
ncbi:MAG: hypothetical protein KAT61_09330 [Gammaproteobacteria bacterium]|nr:hypothetical protein [Gammaproteobacteria bacterium]